MEGIRYEGQRDMAATNTGQYGGEANLVRGMDTQAPQPAPPTTKYQITITEMDYGYIVKVGCKEFCIESKDKVVAKIAAYLANRNGLEKAFYGGKLDMS